MGSGLDAVDWSFVGAYGGREGTCTKQLDMGTSGPNTAFPLELPLLVASCTFRGEDRLRYLGLDIPCKELN